MKINTALIVDDESDICFLLKMFLNRKDVAVHCSNNLKDGLSKIKELNPDVLILDHNLPDGYGIDFISNFRKQNNLLLIIVISALSHLKNKALKNGADFFIEKPIIFSELSKLIN